MISFDGVAVKLSSSVRWRGAVQVLTLVARLGLPVIAPTALATLATLATLTTLMSWCVLPGVKSRPTHCRCHRSFVSHGNVLLSGVYRRALLIGAAIAV